MPRVIDPPRHQFQHLRTPLTQGEERVLDLFDGTLSPKWEIYVKPHLNGRRPSLALVNPDVGIAVFEIEERSLDTDLEVARRAFLRIRNTKRDIQEIYCPSLDSRLGLATITAGTILTCARPPDVRRVIQHLNETLQDRGLVQYPRYYPISGSDDIGAGNIGALFPEGQRTVSRLMKPAFANDLRGWLRSPYFAARQSKPLRLNRKQEELVTNPKRRLYRRVKGPAGSGKSVVISARASTLAAEGKEVLVVCFNVTLINYLRHLCNRRMHSLSDVHSLPTLLHFHEWCRSVCRDTGHDREYKESRPKRPSPTASEAAWRVYDKALQGWLDTALSGLVRSIYRTPSARDVEMPTYDAILVDEGQDFHPLWLDTLRDALRSGGEVMLVADKTQNIYGTAAAWTDQRMRGAGFTGRWNELTGSYRLPGEILPRLRQYAKDFLTREEVDVPRVPRSRQGRLSDVAVRLRWVQVRGRRGFLAACGSETGRMMNRLHSDTAFPDVVCLFSARATGLKFVENQTERGIPMIHTFGCSSTCKDCRELEAKWRNDRDMLALRRRRSLHRWGVERAQKHEFFRPDSRHLKATTPHSFKGWETRQLIVAVESMGSATDRALLYTAMTRLLDHDNGSSLTVISCCDELREYGKDWPEYSEVGGPDPDVDPVDPGVR